MKQFEKHTLTNRLKLAIKIINEDDDEAIFNDLSLLIDRLCVSLRSLYNEKKGENNVSA